MKVCHEGLPGLGGGLLASQEGRQEGNGGQAEELDALLLQALDRGLDLPAAAEELGLDGAGADAQVLGDLPHGELFIVVHAHEHPLAHGEAVQDLPDVVGGLLPLQPELRGALGAGVRQLGDPRAFLGLQLGEEHRGLLPQHRAGPVDGDAMQPGAELAGLAELIQMGKGVDVGVLLDVQGRVLGPDHGADGPVDLLVRRPVEGGIGVLVAGPGPLHQGGELLRAQVRGLFLFHALAPPA